MEYDILNGLIFSAEIEYGETPLRVSLNIKLENGCTQLFFIENYEGNNFPSKLTNLFTICDVEKFSDIVGCPIRVKTTHKEMLDIGHFLNSNWLNNKYE